MCCHHRLVVLGEGKRGVWGVLTALTVCEFMGLSQESTRFPLEPLAMVKSAIIRTIVIKSVNCNADLDLALTVAGLRESRFEPGL